MKQSLIRQLETLEKAVENKAIKHLDVDIDNHTFTVLTTNPQKVYKPEKTGIKLHSADTRVQCVMGPMGSGKSVMCVADIVLRTCAMPKCVDGIRRAKWAIVRNTYGDFMRTTRRTWFDWFSGLGTIREIRIPEYSITHTFNDQYGPVELEILPIALDHVQDVPKRLKSLEITGVYLNEMAELLPDVLGYFKARIPRFPSKDMCPEKYWSGVIADTNPPPLKSWIYEMFEQKKPEGHVMYRQPPALLLEDGKYIPNPEAENVSHQPAGYKYWLDMIQGQSEEWIKVYALGDYGILSYNQIVYRAYNDDLHSTDKVEIYKDEPIIIGVDLGTHCPAAIIAQLNGSGQLGVFKEFYGNFLQISELFENFVIPWLNINCEGLRIETVIYDPANTLEGAQQLDKLGFLVQPGYTNTIVLRLDAVSCLLNKLVSGNPRLVIDRNGCPKLREGFLGEYHYRLMRVIGETKFTNEPDKTHPFSDLHDALQYIALHVVDKLKLDSVDRVEDEYDEYYDRVRRNDADSITGY